ncbi:MAG: glycosyltransferase family 4 protein [Bacteroidota bacterium]
MKILQLCRKFPYPLKDGESIAVTYLAKAYRSLGCELTLLSFNTIKHYFEVEKLPTSFDHYEQIETVYLDNYPEPIGAFLNLFSKKSYHITRFTVQEFADKLQRLLRANDFDFVQMESVYFAPYIPLIRRFSTAKIVMRAHNVEFEIWERVAKNTSLWPKKWYLNHLVKKLRRYEVEQLGNYDLLLAMTAKDLAYFRKLGFQGQGMVVPIGLQLDNYPIQQAVTFSTSISFIGSLDWVPNQEGLSWFIQEVWPDLRKKIPALELHIAGRNTPDWIFAKAGNGIVVHGEVSDAKAFLRKHPVTVVPLFSGSGMRVKILEGMALGRVVVTTTLGMEGIDALANESIVIANERTQFIDAISAVFKDAEKAKCMMQLARELVEREYNNQRIAALVFEAFEAL